MSTTAQRPHFSVAIDWKQRDIEQWLEQYGSWLLIDCRFESLGANSIMGKLLDMAQGVKSDNRRRALPRCNISDQEAEAIESLINHIFQTETTKAKKWIQIVVSYHIEGLSEEAIAVQNNMSRFGVTRDKMHGIIRIVSKHSYLRSRLID
ncbi:antiterminator Q family protein [Acinetobacter indicus]|uniref:antiterminator Q family protein n=1 Tax=Acinetobacter indicus TaxID=756892 RepID=UPI0014442C5A|nr:antiterminator Q family protein [Acinetobacter indicus]